MIKPIRFAVAAFVAFVVVRNANAWPTAFFDPATGGIWISNDGDELYTFEVYSPTGNAFTTDVDAYAKLPSDPRYPFTRDLVDLPLGFIYFGVPVTAPPGEGSNFDYAVKIGNVVVPGTHAEDLYYHFAFGFDSTRIWRPVVVIPEPTSTALVGAPTLLLGLRSSLKRASRRTVAVAKRNARDLGQRSRGGDRDGGQR